MQATSDGGRVFPVSVKGVVVRDGQILLLKNERDEWELPGGKLELGEAPEACVAREITEETGLPVVTGPILDSWQYHISESRDVVIITYGCHPVGDGPPVLSNEHKEIGMFPPADVPRLNMPDGYKQSITSWLTRLAVDDARNPGDPAWAARVVRGATRR